MSDAYEAERQDWIKNGFNSGTGEKTPKTNRQAKDIHSILSCHVETVCLLSNTQKKKDVYFTVDVDVQEYRRIKKNSQDAGQKTS